jgi:hypothetical protein
MIPVTRVLSIAAVVATLQLVAPGGEPYVVSGFSQTTQQRPGPPDDPNPPTVQEQELLLGTWELDLARSTFQPGPAPRGEIRSYQEEHEGIKAIILTTHADGSKTQMEYLASFNDVTAVVTGSQQTNAIRLRKIDTYTAEGELSLNGKPVGRARRVISPDGQTLTITLDRTAPVVAHNVNVYKRVK